MDAHWMLINLAILIALFSIAGLLGDKGRRGVWFLLLIWCMSYVHVKYDNIKLSEAHIACLKSK